MFAAEPRYLRFEKSPRSPNGRAELLACWHSVRRQLWLILAAGALLALLAGLLSLRMPPLFEAEALLLINDHEGRLIALEDIEEHASGRSHFVTQAAYLGSRSLGLRVVKQLKLWQESEFDPRRAAPGLRARLLGLLGKKPEVIEWTPDLLAEVSWQIYASRLLVAPLGQSQLLAIRFYAGDPALAARVANEVAASYLASLFEARLSTAGRVDSILGQHEARQLRTLNAAEQKLQDFRSEQGLSSLGGSDQALLARRISALQAELAGARSLRIRAENAWQQARASPPEDRLKLPGILADAPLQSAQENLDLARQKLAGLQLRYGSEHPRLREAAAEAASAQTHFSQLMETALAALEADARSTRSREQLLQTELDQARHAVQGLNQHGAQLAELERQAAAERNFHERFSLRHKVVRAQSEKRGDPARLIQPASPQLQPVKPDRPRLILGAGLFGLILAALLAIVRDRLAPGVFSAGEAEARFGRPVLAELPSEAPRKGLNLATAQRDQPQDRFAAHIRQLASAILLSAIDQPCRLTLLCSSLPGEGKSTLSANLALALAQHGPCLLIDADLRRAGLSQQLGMPRELPGLGDHLQHGVYARRCIHRLLGSELHVLPAGIALADPLASLQSPRLSSLLQELAPHYTHIIIDSPPLGPVSDALILAPLCTRSLLVVRAADTAHALARRSLLQLERAGGQVLGIVLNHSSAPANSSAALPSPASLQRA